MHLSDHPLLDQALQLCTEESMQPQALQLNLTDYPIRIHSNSDALLKILADYFIGLCNTVAENAEPLPSAQTVCVYQTESLQQSIQQTAWIDWQREPGKTGRKDAIADTDFHGHPVRLLFKVKTGMLFLQPAPLTDDTDEFLSPKAFGPAETCSSQIINFILTQYLNHHLRHQWLLGHASAMQIDGKGLAFAGLSGGGKSTLMLHLLEDGQHFVSNDRLLMKMTPDKSLTMRGIPKQPRINPGTIVHNPRLHGLISEQERKDFLAMPSESLRALEQKYDAPVDQLYHADCYRAETPMHALFILNWQAQSQQPTQLHQVDINTRHDLLPAIMKTPGPFYAKDANGFLVNGVQPEATEYLSLLTHCQVYEITGNIDFDAAKQLVLQQLPRI